MTANSTSRGVRAHRVSHRHSGMRPTTLDDRRKIYWPRIEQTVCASWPLRLHLYRRGTVFLSPDQGLGKTGAVRVDDLGVADQCYVYGVISASAVPRGLATLLGMAEKCARSRHNLPLRKKASDGVRQDAQVRVIRRAHRCDRRKRDLYLLCARRHWREAVGPLNEVRGVLSPRTASFQILNRPIIHIFHSNLPRDVPKCGNIAPRASISRTTA